MKALNVIGLRGGQYLLIFLLAIATQPLHAQTITIGRGSGIVWEGLPFNASLSGGYSGNAAINSWYAMLMITFNTTQCLGKDDVTTISGYKTFQIAPGVGLIPRATANASYNVLDGSVETLSGTLGLPDTIGRTSTGINVGTGSFIKSSTAWCLNVRDDHGSQWVLATRGGYRTVSIKGNWAMVADGNQTSQEIKIPTMYAASFAGIYLVDTRYQSILPGNITLRISALSCTVATTTNIDFGSVQRNSQVGAELATLSYPLNVSCGQPTDKIDANINVQFSPISGLYNTDSSKLALTQGGGYITGEIVGVTGSGSCVGTTGLRFNNTQYKLGSITSMEQSKVLNNQITWRLCSGGASLPTGNVDASAEMLVTFN